MVGASKVRQAIGITDCCFGKCLRKSERARNVPTSAVVCIYLSPMLFAIFSSHAFVRPSLDAFTSIFNAPLGERR